MTNPILENILARRSCRSFTPQPVEREKLEAILTAAIWAPSGNNQQDWHFTMLANPAKIQQLAKAVGKACGRAESYNFFVPAALLLISGNPENRNALLDSAAAQENALLTATSLGLGTCWINQFRDCHDDPDVRELLTEFGIPQNHLVYTAAAIGYMDKATAAHKRAENTVTFID